MNQFSSWLLGDRLGSTSMVADASGTVVSELRYSAFGETRYQYIAPNETLRTDYLYTGQRERDEIGLYYYIARWYGPAIGRFIQADSVVPNPNSSRSYDRFSYVFNNPVNYSDPAGHFCFDNGICDDSGNTEVVEPPTILNWSELPNEKSGRTKYSAQDFYRFYRKLWLEADGWWWDELGSDGDFSLWDGMATILVGETYRKWQTTPSFIMGEAAGRSAYAWIKHTYKENAKYSDEQFLNWFALFADSGEQRVGKGVAPSPFEWVGFSGNDLKWVSEITDMFSSRDPQWQIWDGTRPFGWADINLPELSVAVDDGIIANNPTRYYYWDGIFLVPDGCLYKMVRDGWPAGSCPTQ